MSDPDLMTREEAAEHLGVAPNSVRTVLARHGVTERRGYPREQVLSVQRKPREVDSDEERAKQLCEAITPIVRDHEWDERQQGCRCGWTQRASLGRRMARLNHPLHVADMVAAALATESGRCSV